MNWLLAALAPALTTAVFLVTGKNAQVTILSYHLLCAGAIVWQWRRIRPMLAWTPAVRPWALGATAAILAGLAAPLLVWNPRTVRDIAAPMLFPWKDNALGFGLFAAYTMIVHAPLEEIFWRGAATNAARGGGRAALAGNFIGFYLIHAGALGVALKGVGLLLALPAGLAGVAWAFVTLRSGSLWPALLSHWAADAAILAGMWYFLVRP